MTLVGGSLGRFALTLAASALVVTLLPVLLGWRPYVIRSGSMEPRISVSDVVLASPTHDRRVLMGHVAVFADPSRPGQYKAHRVIGDGPDGALITKGDANPTADSAPVESRNVVGLGRLLVPYAGAPLVWLERGSWWLVLLLLAGLVGASWLTARDHETDDASETVRRRPLRPVSAAGAVGVVAAAALIVPSANAAFSATTRNTASSWTASAQRYTNAVNALGPYLSWQLNDSGAGGTVADSSGNGHTGVYVGGVSYGTTGATPQDTPNSGVTLTNAFSCINTSSISAIAAPTTYTEIVWFKAPTTYAQGGKLIGFENPQLGVGIAGVTSNYDRMIYMDGAGKVWFGVYTGQPSGYVGIGTSTAFNDGAWHMAAATLSSAGMAFYVDGKLQGTNPNPTAQTGTGYWRLGCGNLQGWGGMWTGPNNPDQNLINLAFNAYFTGSLDEASVFSGQALTGTQIAQLYYAR